MTLDQLTEIENQSILQFVLAAADMGVFEGRVLDYGCGRQPYRGVVERAGGIYTGYDRTDFPFTMALTDTGPSEPLDIPGGWDAILCTQVIQYAPRDGDFLRRLAWGLSPGGYLVLTGPTNWPAVNDFRRHTLEGIRRLVSEQFEVVRAEYRSPVFDMGGFTLPYGYGVIARA